MRSKTTAIRQSARGEQCLVRIPGWCNHDPETTVLAHRNGAGMGIKRPDWQAAYCCSGCHRFVDGEWTRTHWNKEGVNAAFYEGIFRTQERLNEKGLLVVKD
ncbi:hypothetical protein CSB45_16230 [candidate division KSB3 bacterium]|uniref:DUF1364 domain-containing protein n=1 Tax=candidate division KSB3 bacterium TaxID=2044937 RepID=A0A2G6E0W7_9BACT|nr:MAG: hypothetical protein CSB45_16230 [candidate division KSB3 bacterium]